LSGQADVCREEKSEGFEVSAASGRRQEGWWKRDKNRGRRYESGLSERSFFLYQSGLSAKIKSIPVRFRLACKLAYSVCMAAVIGEKGSNELGLKSLCF
jgi:hypothetical protein